MKIRKLQPNLRTQARIDRRCAKAAMRNPRIVDSWPDLLPLSRLAPWQRNVLRMIAGAKASMVKAHPRG